MHPAAVWTCDDRIIKRPLVALVGVLSLSVAARCSRPSLREPDGSGLAPVESTLVSRGKALWDAVRRRDVRALSDLLADDTYAVEADGSVLDRRQQLADLENLSITDIRMDSIRVLLVDPDVGIVRYRVLLAGAYRTTPMTPAWSAVSAVWARRNGQWRCVAYHATRIRT
jgi:ketosteroid isomerase-like protein